MRREGEPHPLRCETCEYRYHNDKGKCPYDLEEVYYPLKEEMTLPRGAWLFTSVVGCASHSSAPQPAAAEPIFHLEDCEKCYKALEELKKDLKADAEQRDLAEDLEASQIAYEGMRRAELDKRESQLREIENIIVMNGTAGCGIYINRYISKELKAISLLRGDGKP